MQSSPPLVCGTLLEQTRFARDPVTYLLRHGRREDVTKMWLPVYGVGQTSSLVVSAPGLAALFREYQVTVDPAGLSPSTAG
jgi:hypothetical protein